MRTVVKISGEEKVVVNLLKLIGDRFYTSASKIKSSDSGGVYVFVDILGERK